MPCGGFDRGAARDARTPLPCVVPGSVQEEASVSVSLRKSSRANPRVDRPRRQTLARPLAFGARRDSLVVLVRHGWTRGAPAPLATGSRVPGRIVLVRAPTAQHSPCARQRARVDDSEVPSSKNCRESRSLRQNRKGIAPALASFLATWIFDASVAFSSLRGGWDARTRLTALG